MSRKIKCKCGKEYPAKYTLVDYRCRCGRKLGAQPKSLAGKVIDRLERLGMLLREGN